MGKGACRRCGVGVAHKASSTRKAAAAADDAAADIQRHLWAHWALQ